MSGKWETESNSSLHSNYSHKQQSTTGLIFCGQNRISQFLLEKRIDYHLKRIMKERRLFYFKNSISSLSIQDRIFESILEIINSSTHLIERRQVIIQRGHSLCAKLSLLASPETSYELLKESLCEMRIISLNLTQLIWALNSNKEHIKYVIKVNYIPDYYVRLLEEPIELKQTIINMIINCENSIREAKTIREQFRSLSMKIFLQQSN